MAGGFDIVAMMTLISYNARRPRSGRPTGRPQRLAGASRRLLDFGQAGEKRKRNDAMEAMQPDTGSAPSAAAWREPTIAALLLPPQSAHPSKSDEGLRDMCLSRAVREAE